MSETARTIDSDVIARPTAHKPQRLLSLDVLRGLTIAFMILVNSQTGPGPFQPLTHARWNGFTPTDLVFPTFLFLVGISTVLSIAAREAKGEGRKTLFFHALRRALVLFVFGFVVNNFPFFHLATARYYGVLPRIAICYFLVATMYLVSRGWKDKVAIALACLLGYWVLMRYFPVPGFGVPTRDIPINDMNANLAAWLDRRIFSAAHLYEKVRDPEGLLSTIPALATALMGVLTAIWLRTRRATEQKAVGIAMAGAVCVCAGSLWNIVFPINKKLWTSSFTLFAGGWSLLLLALAIYIVDIKRVGRADVSRADAPEHPTVYKPLLVFGTNSILAYMVSELGDSILHNIHPSPGDTLKKYLFRCVYAVIPHTGIASLTYSFLFMAICWAIVYPFYRKRIFLKI